MKVIINEEMAVDLTAALMAEAFWNMGSDEQADFFHELAAVIDNEQDPSAVTYSHGEMQWLLMTDEIKARSKQAREMFLSFTAFAYDYWPQKNDI